MYNTSIYQNKCKLTASAMKIIDWYTLHQAIIIILRCDLYEVCVNKSSYNFMVVNEIWTAQLLFPSKSVEDEMCQNKSTSI